MRRLQHSMTLDKETRGVKTQELTLPSSQYHERVEKQPTIASPTE
jgi:hypothetical protein